MAYTLHFLIITIIIITINADKFQPMKYKNCKSKFEILSVEAMGCGTEKRCVFTRNSSSKIRIGFKPNRIVNALKTSVWANLGGTKTLTKFYLENDNTCVGNNITCPLEKGQIYYYSQSVNILKEYPTVDVQVNWVITDTENVKKKNVDGTSSERDICIKFQAVVKDK